MVLLLMFVVGWLGPKYLAALIVVGVSYYLYKFYTTVAKYPKGPFPLPFIGNIHQENEQFAFQITPYRLHEDLEKISKTYGDVFTLWMLSQPMVVIMRSKCIKEALIVHGDNFINRTGQYPETVFQTVENGGVLFSSGDNWREQRRNALHILRDFGVGKNIMEEQIHTQLEEFVMTIKELEDKTAVDLNQPIQITVSNIINKLLFGYSYPHNKSERLLTYANAINTIFTDMFKSLFFIVVQIFPFMKKFPYIGYQAVGRHVDKYLWCLEFVKEDVKNALKDYSKEEEPNCFAQAYFQKMDSNEHLDMDNLYNVCADFFMAGMETTSTTLRWAMLYLAGEQDVQEKLRKELASVVGFTQQPSLRDKPEMPYTTAFVIELQRTCNLIPFNIQRKTIDDVEIDGKVIPGGTCVVPQIHSILADGNLFPEPEKLKPERFLNDDGSLNTELISQVAAFGLGKRQCAGESLAKAELFLGVTTFLQKFKISPAKDEKVDYEAIVGSTMMPKPHLYNIEEVSFKDY